MISVTVDAVVVSFGTDNAQILLIERDRDPFAGMWALPGGFLNEGESPWDGTRRELLEETELDIPHEHSHFQIAAFGDPARDPRGHVISVAHFIPIHERPAVKGQDDARTAAWCNLADLENESIKLAFDHRLIIMTAFKMLSLQNLESTLEMSAQSYHDEDEITEVS